ncbi:MAG: 2Fe-2S iron-sulfur cluster-binding protein [Candidatus Thiodiazotropha sp.]
MTSGTLAILIATLILAQILLALWFKLRSGRGADSPPALPDVQPGMALRTAQDTMQQAPAWNGFRAFRVTKREQENEAGDIISFYLQPEQPMQLPPFKPGQYLSVRLLPPQVTENPDHPLTRCYSLSDRPHSEHYRISVKRIPGGRASNYLHEKVPVGARLMVKAPSGAFHLIDQPARPQVLIAGGIGITPMLSMLYSLLDRDFQRDIWLFYGVRNGREAIMLPRLRELAEYHPRFHLQLCFSRPAPEDRPGIDFQHAGHVDAQLLRAELPLNRYHFYLCGPAALMQSLVPGLEDLGVSGEDIHFETFGPATIKRSPQVPKHTATAQPANWQVDFQHSGQSATWDSSQGNLLNFIEAQGIAVDSACRSGSCGSCQTRVVSGHVAYPQMPDTEIEAGHCLLCVGRPDSDLTLAL